MEDLVPSSEATKISGVDFANHSFAKLDDLPAASVSQTDLVVALQSAFWDIRHPRQTAWGEHIPFMFSLMTLAKPRRFVELGVYNGASFLAACQAVRRCNLSTTCVAIDNWLGDVHAGSYSEDVFDSFVAVLSDYDAFAGYIRKEFDQAHVQFADGSIDLLHVDGFHTTEAVQNDFETWLPKMSKRGIMMFHDTNEFREGFGVWRFWQSVRTKFPHFEFMHGHGLGILLVGDRSPLREMFGGGGIPAPVLSNEFLQAMFEGIGRLAWESTWRDKQNALAIKNMKNSTFWRITVPLRALKRLVRRKK
ncbi:class I SAM-dependent methyltransferase [Mesorhizobium sp. VNQ89]|uniref:class I SAM-dependent methyltransferase n=1 Tax=Mesorhizobium quangtriensis TaxID=3157709 RepID=UPI0032B867D0